MGPNSPEYPPCKISDSIQHHRCICYTSSIVELLVEFICSFVGDFLLQLGVELLIEAGLRRAGDAMEQCMPLLTFVAYGMLGLAFGGLSLLVFPQAFVHSSRFHGSSLVISPLLTGLAMTGIGYLRRKRDEPVLRIDTFFYAVIFAFGMALIRLLYTK